MDNGVKPQFARVLWLVMDGVGVGELPDAASFGDTGANTLGKIASTWLAQKGRPLNIPNLVSLGAHRVTPIAGLDEASVPNLRGVSYSRSAEQSAGKDTTSGHWEMVGLPVYKPFPVFENGFPAEIIDRWVKENDLPGILGNEPASGTEIIERLGEEHVLTGKPIVYTSADSVWQIAAHESAFGLDRLLEISKSARAICDELNIGRVIARPFIGNPSEGKPFERTYNRKDYSQDPPAPSVLVELEKQGIPVLGVGKISNIYAGAGISENWDTQGNLDGMQKVLRALEERKTGLIFCNLVDFDMLYGHRRNPIGFGESLEKFDEQLADVLDQLTEQDILIITADHGNDPTFRGTDHTREFVPVLTYSPQFPNRDPIHLEDRTSFADMGLTILDALTGAPKRKTTQGDVWAGQSYLNSIR